MDREGKLRIAGGVLVLGIILILGLLIFAEPKAVSAAGSGGVSGSGSGCCSSWPDSNGFAIGKNCYENYEPPPGNCMDDKRVEDCMDYCDEQCYLSRSSWWWPLGSKSFKRCCYNGILRAKGITDCGCSSTEPKDGGKQMGMDCVKWQKKNCGETTEDAKTNCEYKCENEFKEMCTVGLDNYKPSSCKTGVSIY